MTADKLFGTDGVRAPVSSPHLSPESIARLGRILGSIVKNRKLYPSLSGLYKNCITIGRDTRASSIYLEHALVAGIAAAGVDCQVVGLMPTAAIAFLTKLTKSCLGVMISASHNSYQDNGLKLFGPSGFKVGEDIELTIEAQYFGKTDPCEQVSLLPGKIDNDDNADKDYFSMIKSAFGSRFSLDGLRIVVDCAHGAAYKMAAHIFAEFGCDVRVIGASPDGSNINRGFGSEAPGKLKSEVINSQAHVGLAFDGDADRVIFIDEKGESIDGDAILATIALDLKKCGLLQKDTVVATVMSSVALDRALSSHQIRVVRTLVGDKFVARKMLEDGYSFGGENSGHLIIFPQATTGDGIFSALKFLAILHQALVPASQLVSFYEPTPKLLKNIEVSNKIPLVSLPKTQAALTQANDRLKNLGRVMLRYSGTENKMRLLVEAPTEDVCHKIADEIAHEFETEMSAAVMRRHS